MAVNMPATTAVTVVMIPGLGNSGPAHWQSRWLARRGDALRLEQADWQDPRPETWVATLDALVRRLPGRLVLVAHSLGCPTVAHWVAGGGDVARIGGALLVAPCDVERPGVCVPVARFAPLPSVMLPFRSTLVASSNDPWCDLAVARGLARDWGSTLIDLGPAGHINADSGLGDWPFGEVLLDDLVKTAGGDGRVYRRLAALAGLGREAAV